MKKIEKILKWIGGALLLLVFLTCLISINLTYNISGEEEVNVNSLHAQGIDKIGNGLVIEAVAPDGIIEALSLKSRDQFALGVQWHPEWPRPINSFNEKIFKYFGKACQFYAESKKP